MEKGKKEAMSKTYRFTVTGRGPFPFDMLRYDSAWPTSNGVNPLTDVASSRYGMASSPRRAFSIELASLRTPTVGRWNSFGWLVENVETI